MTVDYPFGLMSDDAGVFSMILEAMKAYKEEVINQVFPAQEHSFTMPDKTLEELKKMIQG